MNAIFTDEQRAAIARAWCGSGLTQEQYSLQHGIKPRTLRSWLQRWPRVQSDGNEQAKAILEKAIASLKALLDSLDADVAYRPAELVQKAVVEEPPRASAVAGENQIEREPFDGFSWS
jgi:transposase-like protein